MGFVKLLYGLLAFWCALVGLLLMSGLGGSAPQQGAAAALAVAAAAIPYIFVRSLEKMAMLRAALAKEAGGGDGTVWRGGTDPTPGSGAQ